MIKIFHRSYNTRIVVLLTTSPLNVSIWAHYLGFDPIHLSRPIFGPGASGSAAFEVQFPESP